MQRNWKTLLQCESKKELPRRERVLGLKTVKGNVASKLEVVVTWKEFEWTTPRDRSLHDVVNSPTGLQQKVRVRFGDQDGWTMAGGCPLGVIADTTLWIRGAQMRVGGSMQWLCSVTARPASRNDIRGSLFI